MENDGRSYIESPSTLYQHNPALLVSDDAGGIEANTECVRVSETLQDGLGTNEAYLRSGDEFYFGWDSSGSSATVSDSCCFLIYGNSGCAIEAGDADYGSWCGQVVRGQFPFDVHSWEVTNCVAMYKDYSLS